MHQLNPQHLYDSYFLAQRNEVFDILLRLDTLLLDSVTKRIKLLSASAYGSIDRQELRIWAHYRARYCIPTIELVDWLKTRIDGRSAIEIGAGNGDLGYHLGIRSIDNGCQQYENVRLAYLAMGQVPTNPSLDVIIKDGVQAILEYQPEVVIGAWITDKWVEGASEGNIYAPDGHQIIQNAEYIRIGSKKIHGRSSLLGFPHETIEIPGLISRTSSMPPDDVIHIWKKLGA
jgi:hypothetical protein